MTKDEEQMLREYAAGRATTQSVIDALGPMSLWSMSAFNAEIKKAVDAEREEIVKDFMTRHEETKHSHNFWHVAANQVKARGNT